MSVIGPLLWRKHKMKAKELLDRLGTLYYDTELSIAKILMKHKNITDVDSTTIALDNDKNGVRKVFYNGQPIDNLDIDDMIGVLEYLEKNED